jgi:hypothetical protein
MDNEAFETFKQNIDKMGLYDLSSSFDRVFIGCKICKENGVDCSPLIPRLDYMFNHFKKLLGSN